MTRSCAKLILFLGWTTGILSCSDAAASESFQMVHDGVERTYHVYAPKNLPTGSEAPLMMVLHGRSSSGPRMERLTGFDARADDHGFIVVYPDALDGTWNYLHGISGHQPRPDDSGYLLDLITVLAERYDIDEERIYAAGISNGGYMTQRLACRAPDRFSGFASVAAGGYGAMPIQCENYTPVNILYIHGTQDEIVPWQGARVGDGTGNLQLVAMPISDSLKFWSVRNHCGSEVSVRELPPKGGPPETRVQVLSATGCRNDAEVALYAVIGGGHNWPGSRGVIPPRIAGRVNMDIHASDVIWSFFRRHRPEP